MKTKPASEVTDADRPFICSRGHSDGTVSLYYEGDEIPPTPVTETSTARIVTAQEFRDRFTDAELSAMLASSDATVKLLVLKIQTADPFPMDKPAVQQGLDYLVAKGIISAARRSVVGDSQRVI